MIELARTLAAEEGIANATFEQADAQIHPFERGAFDVAISRTGAMFFDDRAAAFRNIGRAVRPGGRLTLLNWQAPLENEWFIAFTTALGAGRDLAQPPPTAPSPFALADPESTTAILAAAGFTSIQHTPLVAEMWFGVDSADAQRFILGFLGWMLQGLDAAGRSRAADALHTTLAAHETDHGVVYRSATWLVTANRS